MGKSIVERAYYLMKLGRVFEERAKEEYMKGNIAGFLHLAIGEEAVHVGATLAFGKGDLFVHYREHVWALARGMSPKTVMAELFGKKTGVSKGKGGSMHLFDPAFNFYGGNAIVGAHLPHAVGAAYARKYLGHSEGVLVAFGDGATNAGNYYESLNLASLWELPVLFLNENNFYAIGTRVDRASAVKELYKKAKEFMPAVRIDGMNFFEVFDAVSKAKEYIETEGKPYYIEALTYRYEPHSMADPGDYRSPRELKVFHDKDPVEFLKKEGIKRGLLTQEFIKQIDERVEKEVKEAVQFALKSPEPEDKELYTDIFCEVCTDVVP